MKRTYILGDWKSILAIGFLAGLVIAVIFAGFAGWTSAPGTPAPAVSAAQSRRAMRRESAEKLYYQITH
jgi:hypothetical protein